MDYKRTLELMDIAINEADKCKKAEDSRPHPKVGAVLAGPDGNVLKTVYLLNLLTQTKYASTAGSFLACSLQCCCSAPKCICSGVGWIAIYAIESCAIAIASNAAVANGFIACPPRVEKKPRMRRGACYFLSESCFATT